MEVAELPLFLAPNNLKNLFFFASSPSKEALFQSFQPSEAADDVSCDYKKQYLE
jgi:hypothetical protein